MTILEKLKQAITVDVSEKSAYVNLEVGDEVLSVCAFGTKEEAEAQRELLIDALARLYSEQS